MLFLILFQYLWAIEKIEVIGTPLEENSLESFAPLEYQSVFLETPNLNFSTGGNRSRFFQIRGIGEYSQYETLNQPSVGFFYNGIDLSEEPQTLSLQRNQVLNIKRGSQSIEYGGTGMGGALVLSSCSPSECDENVISADIQNYNSYGGQISMAQSWTPRWHHRFTIKKFISDGYIWNNYLSRPTGKRNESFLEWDQSFSAGSWKFRFFNLGTILKNGYDHFNHDNTRRSFSDRPGKENIRTQGSSFVIERPIGSLLATSTTSFTHSDFTQSFDEDWGNNQHWRNTPGWNQEYDYFSENKISRRKFYQRFLLTGSHWDLGVHGTYRKERLTNIGFESETQRGQIDGEAQTRSIAFYGGYKVVKTSVFDWTSQIRLENQSSRLRSPSLDESQSSLWALRSNKSIQISQKHQLDLSFNRSFRGGGFNLDTGGREEFRKFGAEDLYSAELGWLYRGRSNRQQLNIFYLQRDNQQLRTSFQDDPSDPSSFTIVTTNTGASRTYGVESGHSFIFGIIEIGFSLGLLYSKFQDYEVEDRNLKGRELPYAPQYSFKLENLIRMTPSISILLSHYGKDRFYFSNSHDHQSRAYQLTDIELRYSSNPWEGALFGKNIFNTSYSQRGFYFSNEPPNWEEKLYTQQAPPLMFGVRVEYSF